MTPVDNSTLLAVVLTLAVQPVAQDSATIEQKLTSQYALTKTTADRTDIVTAGAVLVLKKDNLMMVDVGSTNLFQNNYKDGKISQNGLDKPLSRFHLPGVLAAPARGGPQRTWVAGEKMWVTGIIVTGTDVTVQLYTDAINDVRYRADLLSHSKAPRTMTSKAQSWSGKCSMSSPPTIPAVTNQPQQPAPAGGQQPADAALAPIPPPPPPADAPPAAPKAISLGQSKDEVVANLGQPEAIAKVGTKEIYTYPDLKVTFVNGKVTDVQ